MQTDTTETQRIGQRVAELRKAHGMSQRQLAELADMTPGQVGDIERGRYSPSVRILSKMLDPLGYRLAIVPKPTTPIG